MIIQTSKYNEISIKEVRRLVNEGAIHCAGQVRPFDHQFSEFAGTITLRDGRSLKLYAGDDITINNVQLPLAIADDSYFDSSIQINDWEA